VHGVLVGHKTLIYDEPRIARTGVTIIYPRAENIWSNNVYGAYHSLNGNGEMTGVHWLAESGCISSAIAITNTNQVGLVRDALVKYEMEQTGKEAWALPIVAETYDGFLNDIDAFHLKTEHVYEALNTASSGAVAEGNVGGGTGMICHEFKGGIGTASRITHRGSEQYTVGVLVQANYGWRMHLRVNGVPVGREISPDVTASPFTRDSGSIIVIIATDAPLLPDQCKRLAQRATIGLGRVGGFGYNSSGDIFLAFATGNTVPVIDNDEGFGAFEVRTLPAASLNPLFDGVIEATEEAILNALCAAETMTGYKGRTAYRLPHDELQRVMAKYGY
jgi:D-aminopeptidase